MMRTGAALIGMVIMIVTGCAPESALQVQDGNSAYATGDFAAALRHYEPAMVAQPDTALFHYNGGLALAGLERLTHAEVALRQALEAAETLELRADAYYNLGNLYYEQARYAEAVEVYRNALLLRPGDPDAQYNLELALLMRGSETPPPTPLPTDEPTPPPDAPPSPSPTTTPTEANQPPPPPDEAGSTPTDAPSPTPSPGSENPSGGATATSAPTATPSPDAGGQPNNSGADGQMPLAGESDELDEADVNRLLDAIMQDQETLDLSIQPTPLEGVSANDW